MCGSLLLINEKAVATTSNKSCYTYTSGKDFLTRYLTSRLNSHVYV